MHGLSATIEIPKSNVFIPASLKNIRLLHDDEGRFFVEKSGKKYRVKAECTDKELRSLSNEQLAFLLGLAVNITIEGQEYTFVKIATDLAKDLIELSDDVVDFAAEETKEITNQLSSHNYSSYIQVFQYSDGHYGLRLRTRLVGGGGAGATFGFWLGKTATHLVSANHRMGSWHCCRSCLPDCRTYCGINTICHACWAG